ncbi:ATP-grasp domain-containing protein [Micromonospora maritima]|uniref:ATP-grasp domain-containing protein n=1 Tax=Micromonospora maritima TaxID=986711 RepID=UPI0037AB69D6
MRVDDQSSPEAVLAALHRAGLADRVRAVLTSNEESLVTAAVVGQTLGAAALPVTTAVLMRDKELQKRRIRAAGLPTASSRPIDDLAEADGSEMTGFTSAVLKPIAGSATRNTVRVNSPAALRDRARQARVRGDSRRSYLLEEAVTGDEWVADGIVRDGEVVFYALARYRSQLLTLVEDDAPLTMYRVDPNVEPQAYRLADDMVPAALDALGFDNGVFHMELFHDAATGRLIFSECAGRRGGGLIHEEVQRKFGVDLGEAAVLSVLGEASRPTVRTDPATIGSGFLPGRAGTLVECPGPDELMALPGVEFARVHSAVGTRMVGGLSSTTQRLAEILLSAPSPEALVSRADEIRTWFDDRLVVVPEDSSPRQLRDWQRSVWPDRNLADACYSWPAPQPPPG